MFSFKQTENSSEGPDITPLLDVVFILLLFFIIASAFTVRGLEMQVPSAKSSRMISGRIVEIILDERGNIFSENIPIEAEALKFFIQKTTQSFIKQPGQMVLKAHPLAPAQSVIFVVDEVRRQGGESIIIATSDPKEKEDN